MNNKEFGKGLEKRTKDFAISLIKLTTSLQDSPENKVIKHQLIKSGTSIGANYREANTSRSKADFKNRIRISQAEANETLYWLEILIETSPNGGRNFQPLYAETRELFAIFSSIISKLNKQLKL